MNRQYLEATVMKRFLESSLLIAGALLAASCSSSGGGGTNGTLSFDKPGYTVMAGSTAATVITLSGSTSTSGVTVAVTTSAPGVAAPITAPCILSDEAGSTSFCAVDIKGLTQGTATLTAAGPGVGSASATVTVSTTPVPGTLAFSTATESVMAGSPTTVNLILSGSSGVSAQNVGIVSQNTSAATVSPSCTLSTAQSSCPVTITGVAPGSATIIASAVGYPDTTTATTVTTVPGAGKLQFSGNQNVPVSGKVMGTLSLVGSSNVSSFTATLTTGNANATISTTTCPLSSQHPSCSFAISGVTPGTDKISASAAGYDAASMIASVGGPPTPGYLVFSAPSELVSLNNTVRVTLSLGGSSGVTGLQATVASTANASVTPSSCPLSSGGPPCQIEITGVAYGDATITATAPAYASATNSVTVQSAQPVNYGQLQFTALNPPPVAVGSQIRMTLELIGSSNVIGLPVQLVNPSPAIATLSQSSCNLSTIDSTCSFYVTGNSAGTVSISTTSTGPSPQALATVNVGNATPALIFDPPAINLAQPDVGASSTTLTMINLPQGASYSVTFDPQSPLRNSPGSCTFPIPPGGAPCTVWVNHPYTTDAIGSYTFAATATAYNQPTVTATLSVSIGTVTPVQRIITVRNLCNQPVFPAISGGASGIAPTGSPLTCPAGTTLTSAGDCFWTNPAPTNPSDYVLQPNAQTQFVISAAAMQTEWLNQDSGWNGNVMGRLGCAPGGTCAFGSCNSGQTGSPTYACTPGVSFDNPQTMAEFTFLTGQQDTYDITLINGVMIPTSMKPTGVNADGANPFRNGEAGAVAPQVGSNYTLPASTWTFDPASSDSTVPSATYNLLSATGLGGNCNGGTGCPSQQACGYTVSAIQQGSATYQLQCGQRIGYLTAAAIWALNPNPTPGAPFPFTTVFDTVQSPTVPYPNTNGWPLSAFLECPGPGSTGPYQLTSGYDSSSVFASTCGCSDWTGIAYETQTCQVQNSAWVNRVLPKITWIKSGCPTCYSYQYDDMSSTFTGMTSSLSNAANGTNYTITFCPGGTSIPPY